MEPLSTKEVNYCFNQGVLEIKEFLRIVEEHSKDLDLTAHINQEDECVQTLCAFYNAYYPQIDPLLKEIAEDIFSKVGINLKKQIEKKYDNNQ